MKNTDFFYTGLQYHPNLSDAVIQNAKFRNMELRAQDARAYGKSFPDRKPQGLCVSASELLESGMGTVYEQAKALGAGYLVIDTREFLEPEALDEAITGEIAYFREGEMACYLENGYYTAQAGNICRSPYSDPAWLKETVDAYNQYCGREVFGLCMNVGYVNLLAMNMRTFVETVSSVLRLVHMNDNDGFCDDHQLPYTFTGGRGVRTTDFYHLIGALVFNGYRGGIVFDVSGLWETLPVKLQESMLVLLESLGKEWERQFAVREMITDRSKKIILFGTGAMAQNYIDIWAPQYPPYRMVDNNRAKWGKEFHGIPVASPESILEIPKEERNVIICNRFYDEVSVQLDKMGVTYQYYNDNYYM